MESIHQLSRFENWLPFGVSIFFLIWIICFPPQTLQISDEVEYFEQALAFAQGKTTLEQIDPTTGVSTPYRPSDYPPGTSLLLAIFILLFGKSGAFLLPVLSLIGSYWLMDRLLRQLGFSPLFALLLFIYPPAVLLARNVMSDLPSLLLVSAGLFLFYKQSNNRNIFFLGLLGGISILFRETNFLIFLPLLLLKLRASTGTQIAAVVMGLAIGFGLRLGLSTAIFSTPFFIKDPGVGFSFLNIWKNLPLYSLALLIFIPLGLWTVVRYRGPHQKMIQWTIGLFTLFYLAYGYNGWANSGLKGLILGPRFFIPLLPFFVLTSAFFFQKQKDKILKKVKAAYLVAAFLTISASNLFSYYNSQSHLQFIQVLQSEADMLHVVDQKGDMSKYLCRFHPPLPTKPIHWLTDSIAVDKWLQTHDSLQVHALMRYDSPSRLVSNERKLKKLESLMTPYKIHRIQEVEIWDQSRLKTWTISRP